MPKRKRQPEQRESGRGRSSDSFARKQGDRPQRQSILIVCEGAETEPRYFLALRDARKLQLVQVVVEPGAGGSNSLRIVRAAIEKREERARKAHKAERKGRFSDPAFDEVWCVFDREQPQHNASFDDAIRLARAESIGLAVSNACFEYWYLLHYRETSQPFASGQELKQILKRHVANYEEKLDMYPLIKDLTATAIERARRLLENHPDHDQEFPNPSTTVYLLVQRLEECT